MGVKIGSDAAKSGSNTTFLVIMCLRLSQKIGLIDLTNRTRFKKGNGQKQRMKSVHNYYVVSLMLHTPSYYYTHQFFALLGVCQINILNLCRCSLRTLDKSVKLYALKKQRGLVNEYLGCLSHHCVRILSTVTFFWHAFFLPQSFLSFFSPFPFECVFSLNKNPEHPKLSMYTPRRHQYIILLTEDMSSAKY